MNPFNALKVNSSSVILAFIYSKNKNEFPTSSETKFKKSQLIPIAVLLIISVLVQLFNEVLQIDLDIAFS